MHTLQTGRNRLHSLQTGVTEADYDKNRNKYIMYQNHKEI